MLRTASLIALLSLLVACTNPRIRDSHETDASSLNAADPDASMDASPDAAEDELDGPDGTPDAATDGSMDADTDPLVDSGGPVASLCDHVTCQEHASCHESGGVTSCRCDEGYLGSSAFCYPDPCYRLCDTDPVAACQRLGVEEASCTCVAGFRGDGIGEEGCAPYLTKLEARPGTVELAEPAAGKVYIAPWREQVEWQAFASAPSHIELGSTVLEAGIPTLLPAPPAGELTLSVSAGGASTKYALAVERKPGQTYLVHEPATENDYVGFSVAMSGDYVALGVPNDDGVRDHPESAECEDSGAVLVVHRPYPEADWTDRSYVKVDRCVIDAQFGFSVALQGEWLVAGAYWESGTASSGASVPRAGAAYVFKRNAQGKWDQRHRLAAPEPVANETFGYAVSIDGDRLVVGAPFEDNGATGGPTGSVHVFRHDETSDAWLPETRLVGSHSQAYDRFGASVALSGDLLAIGATREEVNGIVDAGGVYVLRRASSGSWSEVTHLPHPAPGAHHHFGYALALDGTRLAVTAPHETKNGTVASGTDAPRSGATYVFEGASFGLVDTLSDVAAPGDESPTTSVALDGDWLVVGDVQRLSNGGGRVYMFRREADEHWHEFTTLAGHNPASNDQFGTSVAIEGGRVLVGARREDGWDDQTNASGAAYVLE